jgi:glycosyltransferase involved in cell wall biosynthesis
MHVAMLTGDLAATSGGPPQVMYETARALARSGVRVTLMALTPADGGAPADPEFAGLPVAIERYPPSGVARLKKSRALGQALESRIAEFDALHVHGVWEGCLSDAAAIFRRAGKPVFVSAHGMLDPWSLRQSRGRKAVVLALTGTGTMLAQATAIVFATAEESAAARHPGSPAHAIVPNGIDPQALAAAIAGDAQPLLDRAPMLGSPGRTILYFSRIHPKKGLDLLADGFIGLAGEHPDARLLVVGIPQDEAYAAAIVARLAAAGLGERAAFVTDLFGATAKPALRHAAIFALPSHQEGFSIALLEALGAGLPVLITDQCHFPEVAEEGAGRVVPDDAAGVAAGLAGLLALDGAQLAAMGKRGRQMIAQRYSLEQIAEQLVALYSGRVNRGATP